MSKIEESLTDPLSQKDKLPDSTLYTVFPATNGDVILKFKNKDDVAAIASEIETKMDIKAYVRRPLLPKMKMAHIIPIPQYTSLERDELQQQILNSNPASKNSQLEVKCSKYYSLTKPSTLAALFAKFRL